MPNKNNVCPNHYKLVEPVFNALVKLGGSANNDEIYEAVIDDLQLSDMAVETPHKNGGTELKYELAWAKSSLKNYGAITNASRGIWVINPEYANHQTVNTKEVMKAWQTRNQQQKKETSEENSTDAPEEIAPWRSELLEILQHMDPFKFEKLIQLLLRTSGFTSVKVTQKSNDGGIDGTGKYSVNGMISFSVAFQCKRYSGSVSASAIRDFRGSLTTDIEKGLYITTGTFTQSAVQEASVPGKQEIDLIDADDLIDRLLDCKIGVTEEKIYKVDRKFFSEF